MNKLLRMGITLLLVAVSSPAYAQKTSQELFDEGQELQKGGNEAKAIELFEKAIELDGDFAPAYSALGQHYLEQGGNLEDIIWLFDKAANLQPKNPENYNSMCRAYFQNQKYDWAEAACLKTLSVDSTVMGAKLTLAWVYLAGKGQPSEAIKYFKEVLEKTQNPRIYWGLGMAYAQNNDKGHVLEIITLLRNKGEEALASQLEKLIRPRGEMPVESVDVPKSGVAAQSKIVKGSPEPDMPAESLPSSLGTQKIQLKGKISLMPQPVESQPATSSGEVAESEVHETSAKERLEKMRQGNRRRGQATGTMHLQGGTGTATGRVTGSVAPAATP